LNEEDGVTKAVAYIVVVSYTVVVKSLEVAAAAAVKFVFEITGAVVMIAVLDVVRTIVPSSSVLVGVAELVFRPRLLAIGRMGLGGLAAGRFSICASSLRGNAVYATAISTKISSGRRLAVKLLIFLENS